LAAHWPGAFRWFWEWGFFWEIWPCKEWGTLIPRGWKKAGLEAHHLIEERFAKRVFGLKSGNVPAVVLDRTFHQQEVTARLFRALPPGRNYTAQEIWNAYRRIYGAGPEGLNRPDWLEAIWPYFARLGVKR